MENRVADILVGDNRKMERQPAYKGVEKEGHKNNFPFLKVGIVGTGLMGKHHAIAAGKSGGIIVAVADLNQSQAIQFARTLPGSKVFSDVAEMLDKIPLDVLHICTPTESHQKIAELAIKQGINVLIEKPLAETAEETEKLFRLALKKSVYLCPVHQFAFQSGVEKAKNLPVLIGETLSFQAIICSAGGTGLNPEQIDSIAVDILPHPLSLAQILLNDLLPEDNWTVFNPRNGEFSVYGQVGQVTLSILVSMNARPPNNSLKIVGTKGTIYFDLFHGFSFLEKGKVSKIRKILRPFNLSCMHFLSATLNLFQRVVRAETAYPGLRELVTRFYLSIKENSEPPITPAQAINIARIRDCLINNSAIKRN